MTERHENLDIGEMGQHWCEHPDMYLWYVHMCVYYTYDDKKLYVYTSPQLSLSSLGFLRNGELLKEAEDKAEKEELGTAREQRDL